MWQFNLKFQQNLGHHLMNNAVWNANYEYADKTSIEKRL
jgi:hypothetical protein